MKVIAAMVVFTALFFGSRPLTEYVFNRNHSEGPDMVYMQLPNGQIIQAPADQERVLLEHGATSMPKTNAIPEHSLPWEPLSVFFWPLGIVLIYTLFGVRMVNEWERVPVLRFGKYASAAGPGLVWYDPFTSEFLPSVLVADDVSSIEIEGEMTHNNIPISFDAVMTSRVISVKDFTVQVNSDFGAVVRRAAAVLSSAISSHELDAILHERDKFDAVVLESLKPRLKPWGIEVVAIEIKDVEIDDEQILRAIAMKAKASKEGEAEVVRAQMQEQVCNALCVAADSMTEEAWRLKEIEAMIEIARSGKNNTIIPSRALDHMAFPIKS